MRIAVVGSREYGDLGVVRRRVGALPSDTIVVSGGAHGVDQCAERAARARGLHVLIIPAEWKRHGHNAGVIRNTEIARVADRVVAFWDERSRGTRDVVSKFVAAGKDVEVYGARGEVLYLHEQGRRIYDPGANEELFKRPPGRKPRGNVRASQGEGRAAGLDQTCPLFGPKAPGRPSGDT